MVYGSDENPFNHEKVNELKGQYDALHYVGIAYDEQERRKKEQYPLIEWKITETEALKFAMTVGLILEAYMKSITGPLAGAAPSRELMNSVN